VRGAAFLLVLASVGSALVLGSVQAPAGGEQAPRPPFTPPKTPEALEQLVKTTCTECHRQPTPDVMPRDMWRETIVRMMFIREKRLAPFRGLGGIYKNIQLPPDMAEVLKYMEARAPEHLPAPEPWPAPGESPVQFTRSGLSVPDMPNDPAVSNVNILDFDGDGRVDVLATEMRQGLVFAGPLDGSKPLTVVASIPHPDHVTLTDVDNDGVKDLLVADLGQFLPGDHHDGAAIWMRGLANGKFSAFWIDGLPRVADVETADFNGDGKNDLAVAAYGWRTTGNVTIYENQSEQPTRPAFVPHEVDKRPGSIHIIPIDLNKDGKMDFITLLAQQFETILSYTNTGKGDFSFTQRVIYAAPHPNWGSSGIQVVDLDKDGDPDVLYTHGDTFDDGLVKPYHGIQWLENTGGPFWENHDLVQMAGVHRAEAADVDGDGDLDIVACGLLAGGSDQDESKLPALVWLEQTKPGVFVRHTIEMGFPRHATLDVGDIDGDGDVDIITGYFSIDRPAAAWVEVWKNQLKK
jgi:hypothetical protein